MNLPKSNPARTILTIIVGFVVIFLIINKEWLKFSEVNIVSTGVLSHTWLLIVSFIIGVVGVLSQTLSKKIEWLWFKVISLLGLVMPKVFLTIVFYFVLLPIALLSRSLSKKKPLILPNVKNTLFVNRNSTFHKDSFEDPW